MRGKGVSLYSTCAAKVSAYLQNALPPIFKMRCRVFVWLRRFHDSGHLNTEAIRTLAHEFGHFTGLCRNGADCQNA